MSFITCKIVDGVTTEKMLGVKVDTNGNIYFVDGEEYYFLYIDGKNNLVLYLLNKERAIDIEKEDLKLKKIIKHTNLKSRIVNEQLDVEDDETNDDEDEQRLIRHHLYNPEDKWYEIEHDNDEDDVVAKEECEEEDDEYIITYSFYGICDKSKYLLPYSIYDTIIINGDVTDTSVSFRSSIKNDSNYYNLTLYTMGYVKLNIIGSIIKQYELFCIDGEYILKEYVSNVVLPKY